MNQTTFAPRVAPRQALVYAVLVALASAGLAVAAMQGSRLPWMDEPIVPSAAPLPITPSVPSFPVGGSSPFMPETIEPIGGPDLVPALPGILPPVADNTRPFDLTAPRPMAPGAPFKQYTTDESAPGY